jgi:hypothetical protein
MTRVVLFAAIGSLCLILSALVICSAAGAAQSGPIQLVEIGACKTITKPGFYRVKKPLSPSPKSKSPDCLTVAAANVTLTLLNTITGHGHGIGIHVRRSGKRFTLVSGQISGFAIGIQDDADNASISELLANNNADTGVLINGASGSSFHGNANHNGVAGVHIKSATGTDVHETFAMGNGTYGLWVDSSTNTAIDDCITGSSGKAGIYLGCSVNGPGGSCPGVSTGNKIGSGEADDVLGIAIDPGDLQNVITGLNGAASQDSNSNCGTNLWMGNTIRSPSQPCEQ